MIPFVDLKLQYLSIKEEIDKAIQDVINNTAFIGGDVVQRFEKSFAEFLTINHCVSCANGTDSLEILLQALNVGPGDEVLVPAVSWISTSEAVSSVGATPVFVDIDPTHYTIDIEKVEKSINQHTKAIIPVHLYGQPVNMIKIMDIAKRHQLKVIEDCAQAHGAEFQGKKIGTYGDAASFSFYPGKNLGAYGDAGCMVTNNDEIAERARMIANHGQKQKHQHFLEGRNSRMDGLQAAILSVKLKYLNEWTEKRIALARSYSDMLKDQDNITTPKIVDEGKHVFHLYVIQHQERELLQEQLKAKNIATAVHYPTALPFLDCYEHLKHTKDDFPVAFAFTKNIVSLPLFPELTNDQQTYICATLKNLA